MDRDWTPLIVPLGVRLHRLAERIALAKKPRLAWLSEAKAVLEELAAKASNDAVKREARAILGRMK